MSLGIILLGWSVNAYDDPTTNYIVHTKTLRYLDMDYDYSFYPEIYGITHNEHLIAHPEYAARLSSNPSTFV